MRQSIEILREAGVRNMQEMIALREDLRGLNARAAEIRAQIKERQGLHQENLRAMDILEESTNAN